MHISVSIYASVSTQMDGQMDRGNEEQITKDRRK